ncbi:MAG: DUF4198 domain-containing protein [Gammaproteobacteria bacterium]|nr:DUF4198 domain-containing protein [Gammaproteobacteria bacterium]
MTGSNRHDRPAGARAVSTTATALVAGLAIGVALLAPTPTLAHFSWLAATLVDERLAFVPQFGHHLPAQRALSVERIDSAMAFDPAGQATRTERTDQSLSIAVGAPGTYVLSARLHPRFWSRTTEGGRNASRRDYPDAFSCRASIDAVTTLVNTGTAKSSVAQAAGHDFELIAQQDPSRLSAGDRLEVLILFRGQPWQGSLQGTWAGYAPEHDDDYPVNVETDHRGIAQIELSRRGGWLLWASTRELYADPETCDEQAWNATLTFEVP